ncbi:MAG: DUF971 domain-containing protein [bacterium]
MAKIPHPTQVKYVSEQGVLDIEWSDDTQSLLSCAFLRGYCPCAHCQGHSGGPPKWVVPATPAASRVENATPVGTYAICIAWGDGHDTGIYSFEFLRSLGSNADFDASSVAAGTPLEGHKLG